MKKKNIDRRLFIKGSAFAGLSGLLANGTISEAMKPGTPSALPDEKIPVEKIADQHLKLSYNRDGKFKILQLTDTHYVSGDPLSVKALNNVNEMLDTEKPDLVIHTGDVIFGKPAEKSIREILEPISHRKIPFAVVFGNHDDEFDKTRRELYEIVRSIPYNITSTTDGIYGLTNYIITLGTSDGQKTDRIFYMFDSNTYSTIEGNKGYGYIHFNQINWYRNQSQYYTNTNGGNPIPALAFFHIPLPEQKEAARDDGAFLTGTRSENVCPSDFNSGMFVSMKEMGDIQAMFLGHDHDNDYSLYWNNMFFIYGRFSGCDTVYNNLRPNGARVIELKEGEKSFRSWIRLSGGSVIQDLKYPDDFIKR